LTQFAVFGGQFDREAFSAGASALARTAQQRRFGRKVFSHQALWRSLALNLVWTPALPLALHNTSVLKVGEADDWL
jgi:hypothetical protein